MIVIPAKVNGEQMTLDQAKVKVIEFLREQRVYVVDIEITDDDTVLLKFSTGMKLGIGSISNPDFILC